MLLYHTDAGWRLGLGQSQSLVALSQPFTWPRASRRSLSRRVLFCSPRLSYPNGLTRSPPSRRQYRLAVLKLALMDDRTVTQRRLRRDHRDLAFGGQGTAGYQTGGGGVMQSRLTVRCRRNHKTARLILTAQGRGLTNVSPSGIQWQLLLVRWSVPLNPRPTGGGGYFEPPPLVFLRYLLNQCRYHHQTCSTLSPNNFTHCVKILKSRVL